jgi:Domain of unknown function (DUF4416)
MRKSKSLESPLLFTGTLYSNREIFNQAREILEREFGDILLVSPPSPWDYSHYYKEELGSPVLRQFIFFKTIIDPGTLADIKIKTIEIENALSSDRGRRINLDPGYITLAKIVLASTKNYSHRIYLGKGIYAELTLLYRNRTNTYTPHLFTYTDYKEEQNIDLFLKVREMLKKILEDKHPSL